MVPALALAVLAGAVSAAAQEQSPAPPGVAFDAALTALRAAYDAARAAVRTLEQDPAEAARRAAVVAGEAADADAARREAAATGPERGRWTARRLLIKAELRAHVERGLARRARLLAVRTAETQARQALRAALEGRRAALEARPRSGPYSPEETAQLAALDEELQALGGDAPAPLPEEPTADLTPLLLDEEFENLILAEGLRVLLADHQRVLLKDDRRRAELERRRLERAARAQGGADADPRDPRHAALAAEQRRVAAFAAEVEARLARTEAALARLQDHRAQ